MITKRSRYGSTNMEAGSFNSALHLVLEEIIFWVHSCNECCKLKDEELYDIYETCRQSVEHRHNLFACLLVSKAWMDVALQRLWDRYAHSRHLVALIFGNEANPYRWKLRSGLFSDPVSDSF